MRIASLFLGAVVAGVCFIVVPEPLEGLRVLGETGDLSRLGPRSAHATTSVLLSLDELVLGSERVAVVRALERRSAWEVVAGSKRIVTYTRLAIDEHLDARASERELWVRTLGGRVGDLGQHVAGEAQLELGKRALVFVARGEGAWVVAGMAQGHFPLVELEGEKPRLAPSPDAGRLLQRRGPSLSAREQLVGKPLGDAVATIQDRVRALRK